MLQNSDVKFRRTVEAPRPPSGINLLSYPSRICWRPSLTQNRSKSNSWTPPEAAVVSGRCSLSHLEENDASVHVFETAIIFRTPSTTPSSPGATASSLPSDFSAGARRRRPNPNPTPVRLLSLFSVTVRSRSRGWIQLTYRTDMSRSEPPDLHKILRLTSQIRAKRYWPTKLRHASARGSTPVQF
jgi:hypothetical protein